MESRGCVFEIEIQKGNGKEKEERWRRGIRKQRQEKEELQENENTNKKKMKMKRTSMKYEAPQLLEQNTVFVSRLSSYYYFLFHPLARKPSNFASKNVAGAFLCYLHKDNKSR